MSALSECDDDYMYEKGLPGRQSFLFLVQTEQLHFHCLFSLV
jgi:hypothetical protein